MTMFLKVALGVLILAVFSEDLFVSSEPSWTSLRATWSVNLFSSRAFAKLPRRESKARAQGWTKIPGDCSGKFLGSRYIKDHDTAMIVIYDVNGYVAGVQTGIPKVDVSTSANMSAYSYANSSAYQLDKVDDTDVYFLTAYFVDPSIICEGGRSDDDYEEEGTGTGLYFQNGTDPIHDAVHVPLYQDGLNVTHWVRGKCFPTMGVHYWYNHSEDMDCNSLFPATIIYNRNKLTSFAFAHFGVFEFSSRFEHPSHSVLGRFFPEPVAQCIDREYNTTGGFTTTHIFFSVRPWNILC